MHEACESMLRTRCLGIALLVCSGVAVAGRPLVTEDASVLGKGECEIETFVAWEKLDDAPTARGWSAQFGCGVGAESQLALNVTRTRADGERVDGAAVVGKTALRELSDDQAGVVLAYTFAGERITAGHFKYDTTAINGVLTVPLAKWLVHANLGWSRSKSAGVDSTTWALAVERTEVGPVDLAVESFGDDRSPPWLQLALRWAVVPSRLFIDASWGAQLSSARPKAITVGAKLAF